MNKKNLSFVIIALVIIIITGYITKGSTYETKLSEETIKPKLQELTVEMFGKVFKYCYMKSKDQTPPLEEWLTEPLEKQGYQYIIKYKIGKPSIFIIKNAAIKKVNEGKYIQWLKDQGKKIFYHRTCIMGPFEKLWVMLVAVPVEGLGLRGQIFFYLPYTDQQICKGG